MKWRVLAGFVRFFGVLENTFFALNICIHHSCVVFAVAGSGRLWQADETPLRGLWRVRILGKIVH
jgi:hypothetical protein